MDNLRGFDPFGTQEDVAGDVGYVAYEDDGSISEDPVSDDIGIDAPPVFSDERRMQVRAYNFWTSHLGDKNYPCIEELNPEAVEDFREYSVLLDFTSGIENPSIQFLGEALRIACDLPEEVGYLDQVPSRSLLSRITDHYLQIIANRAPIGFEAEFSNDQNVTFMYRGILLPYSSDDDTIDFIYGVINWKEVAAHELVQQIELEVGSVLSEIDAQPRIEHVPVWADSPTQQDFDHPAVEADELVLDSSFDSFEDADLDEGTSLADWLVAARHSAEYAQDVDHRSRDALYRAIGRAYDFSLAAEQNTDDYAELLAESGISAQERAPMTPVVKLVFGAGYDKTRLTEFAAALSYAHRNGLERGKLAELISGYEGGLKGVVKAERRFKKVASNGHLQTVAKDIRPKLRAAPARELMDFANGSDEFVVLVARREPDGGMSIIGAVEGDAVLTEKALNKTVI